MDDSIIARRNTDARGILHECSADRYCDKRDVFKYLLVVRGFKFLDKNKTCNSTINCKRNV